MLGDVTKQECHAKEQDDDADADERVSAGEVVPYDPNNRSEPG
jgi:hypothetical protein